MGSFSAFWGLTGAWILLIAAQVWSDARHRQLPFEWTGLAGLVGLITFAVVHPVVHGAIWIGHVAAALGWGGLGWGLWVLGFLGLGDAATFAIFGLLFGAGLTLLVVAASYGLIGWLVIVWRGVFRRPVPDAWPFGVFLWPLSLGAWIWMWIPH
ncbi:Type IV leader peptidase family protein [Sulfobacillus thermosulfidooxidans DSM 9293]|uniref:Type IV leader peptidase family protein n=1 Tax=Sulfobacillus thermosulfidooxidans (strain DSM 9293 / VKM B-1269 / AT-1) TaxID=929705 RepID=A0A1W1W701_SULTA|nr:prepilin peptidase [Sulfobacillus thermosulfidooxidans]SMC02064.1 Type IV leader peptidase family protein [Sulfobacillus thermosulfidooxidans DSM 9293]